MSVTSRPACCPRRAVHAPIVPAPTTTRSLGHRGRSMPMPRSSARRRIASAKTTSASPTPRWLTRMRPWAGTGRPSRIASPMVAVGSGIAVELAGVAVRQELAALVGQEQDGVARDLGGDHRRVVDGDDQGVGRQPVVRHRLALARWREGRGGDHDVRAGDGVAGGRGHLGGGDPGGRAGRVREGLGTFGLAVVDREPDARELMPDHRQVAVPLDAGPDERRARRARPSERARSRRPRPPRSAAR